jgi:hypothetical protein
MLPNLNIQKMIQLRVIPVVLALELVVDEVAKDTLFVSEFGWYIFYGMPAGWVCA